MTITWNETRHVVPAVELWLAERGYTWDSEVTFPNGLRADFVAKHPETGEEMIVEVKGTHYSADRVVEQVAEYRVSYGHLFAKLAIAIPRDALRKSLKVLCNQFGIELILVDCVEPSEMIELPEVPQEIVQTRKPIFYEELDREQRIIIAKAHLLSVENPKAFEIFMDSIKELNATGTIDLARFQTKLEQAS